MLSLPTVREGAIRVVADTSGNSTAISYLSMLAEALFAFVHRDTFVRINHDSAGPVARSFRSASKIRFVLLAIGLFVLGVQGCELLVPSELGDVSCEGDGGSLCPKGQFCHDGGCTDCISGEICGDGIDNDCNGIIDDTCGSDAGTPDAGGDASPDKVVILGNRATQGLVALYAFVDEEGDGIVHDVSGVDPPLDLTIENPENVEWLESGGLQIKAPTAISSETAAGKVSLKCKQQNAITVEAWIRPQSADQNGPASIVSLSLDSEHRNFTLGQELSVVDFRLQTSDSAEGLLAIVSDPGSLDTDLKHVVCVRNQSGHVRIVVDGNEVGSGDTLGNLSTWNLSYRLLLGDEGSHEQAWLGTFHLLAIYEMALDTDTLDQNFVANIPRVETR